MAGACDTPFEPIAEGDVRFPVFGYLDASADTQWIRVMPIRPLATTSPDSFGITVTLEDLGTGRVIPLRDSLFPFTHHADADVGSAGTYVHDFWTTETIERSFHVPVGELRVQAGVINGYDRRNLFYYDLFTGHRLDQRPIAPYASVTLRSR